MEWLLALALRTLEDALAQAEHQPIERQWGHRLALSLLVRFNVAHRWQAEKFWTLLGELSPAMGSWDRPNYVRSTSLHSLLNNWHYAIGSAPPDILKRAEWAKAYAGRVDSSAIDDMPVTMCNRAERGERQHVLNVFSATVLRDFNEGPKVLYPKAPGPVIRMGEGGLVLEQMTWGFPLQLHSKRDPSKFNRPKPVNNARFDKLGAFWKRWSVDPYHRCLIPTARYAEAVGEAGQMTETWLSVKDQPIFAWAGLWSDTDWGPSYTGVMTDNAPELIDIHDRSPVIIDPDDWMAWLTLPLPDLYRFNQPYPADRMTVEATDVPWFQRTAPMPGPLI